jgi:hypothetical protein
MIGNKTEVCLQIEGFGLFSAQVWDGQLDIILGCASLLNLLVAYSIFMKRKLSAHPAFLVGCIALSEGFFAYTGLTRYLICQKKNWVEITFAYTVLFDNS